MGEVFAGRYELVDLIGEGGMGSVWRARDLRDGSIVAAKVLRQSDAPSLLRFVREQGYRIHHPHVVAPLGWVAEDHRVVFAMPLVRGGSLQTLIGDYGALPPLFVAEVLRQVLSALDAVHATRLVHRDIKPANVILDATGSGRPHAYLSDFGIAVDLDGPRLTEVGTTIGTPGYVAPEVLAGGPPSVAGDVFAVGQLGLALLHGIGPNVHRGAPILAPAPLARTLVSMVDADPTRRPSVAAASAALADPVLAWRDTAIGDIEIFDQLAPAAAADPASAGPDPGAESPAWTVPRAKRETRPPTPEPVGGLPPAAAAPGPIFADLPPAGGVPVPSSAPGPAVPATLPEPPAADGPAKRSRGARPHLVRDLVVVGLCIVLVVAGLWMLLGG